MRAVARRRDFRGIPLESRQSSEYQETGGVQCRADADTPPRHPGEVEDYWQERCIFWRRRHRYRVTEGVVGVFWAGSEMIRRDLMLARGRWTCRLPRWWPSQGAISRIISQCTHKISVYSQAFWQRKQAYWCCLSIGSDDYSPIPQPGQVAWTCVNCRDEIAEVESTMTVLQCLKRSCLLVRPGTAAQGSINSIAVALACLFIIILVSPNVTVAADLDAAAAEEHGWPWTPLTRPQVPASKGSGDRHPIDVFLQAKLVAAGLKPAALAPPRTWLRRIAFGLTGLPPDPEMVENFLKNPSTDAYDAQIEHFLNNPAYGERWGRHWLDLVRYADTRGGALDYARPHMWRYRDYVVRAFNQDRPYDRFIREQLAADAYSKYGAEGKLGLAFLHQWVPVERDAPQLNRRDFLNDVVGVTGSVFLGVTLRCARCHDHKFDPLPTRDYYRLEAFFAPLQVSVSTLPFGQYEVPLQQAETWGKQRDQWAEVLDQRKQKQDSQLADFKARLRGRRKFAATGDLKDFVVDVTDAELKAAMQEGVVFTSAERQSYELIRRQTARFANPNHREYFSPLAYSASDSPLRYSVATHILSGGNYELREEQVEPGFLGAIQGHSEPVSFKGVSGPRRKSLAEWIANADNPLTARVMVNRIWQYHFGKGLVATSSDFGKNGSQTEHQELLDWLAMEFIESGWSIKHLQRTILRSHVYRQAMNHDDLAVCEKVDPQNKLLWTRDAIRLEAEVIRDSVLAVSGRLNRVMGGPPFFPDVDDELMQRAPTWWEPSPRVARERRTIYMLQIRSLQMPFIKVFDGPNIDESCPVREVTTVTPQVFALFNSRLLREQSEAMAERLVSEVGQDLTLQIRRAFQLAFQRMPAAAELVRCRAFLEEPEEPTSATSQAEPTPHGTLADFCLVLLNSNEFIFLD